MKTARALLYLTFRTLLNGIKRALTTPRRLIGLLFVVGYYFLFFVKPAMGPEMQMPGGRVPTLAFPPYEVIDAAAFMIFAILSIFMMINLASANTNFKPADVDVLFATPISPRVLLIFRMLRDYLVTLLVPLFIAIVGLKPVRMGWEAIFRNMPDPTYPSLALRFAAISWVLMAMAWISISYGISLHINRSDRDSTRNRRIVGCSLAGYLVILGTVVTLQASHLEGAGDLMELSRSPIVRIPFILATFAAEFTTSPFSDQPTRSAMLGLSGLIGVFCIGLIMAFRQVGWMYDQAAIRALQHDAVLKVRGDITATLAHSAKEGKYKGIRIRWLQQMRMSGPWAMLWREMILMPRVMLGLTIMFLVISIFMNLMPLFIPARRNEMLPGFLVMFLQGMTTFMIAFSFSQVGFLEVLKRVDIQKPFPFTPMVTTWFEVLARGLSPVVPCFISAILVLVMRPELWTYAVSSMVFVPAAGVLISSVVFLVTMLFPDAEDPTQRQFWALMSMLGVILASVIPAGAFVGLAALKVHVFIATVVASILAATIAFVVTLFSSKLYADFNPSD